VKKSLLTRLFLTVAVVGASVAPVPARAQDAGDPDAGQVEDAGEPPLDDAGEPPIDAGEPPPDDAGEPPIDAGEPPEDAGEPPDDAGEPPPPDAGEPPEDAGEPPEDAGEPPICNPGCQDASTLIACGAAGPVEVPCSPGFTCQVDACVLGGGEDGGPGTPVDGGSLNDGGGRPRPSPCQATCIDDRRLGICSASGQVTPVPCATNESCNNDACETLAEGGLDMLACNCGSSGAEGVAWSVLGACALLFWRRRERRAARAPRRPSGG
jgi:MYXO-CTERM domain-containing protein